MKPLLLSMLSSIALLTFLPAADSESGKHLFILSGQSNMRDPLISTFTNTLKKALGDDKVIVASFGQPSASIMGWYRKWTPPEGVDAKTDGAGQLYDKLMANVQKSIKGQKIESVTYVWMQGEADAIAGWSGRYEESFFGVLDQIKADLGVQKINFVIGRINDSYLTSKKVVHGDLIRALQVKMAESRDNGAWIDTDDLNTGMNPWNNYEFDGGHFPNPGYRVMGQRFARKACQLVAPGTKLDEELFAEAFIDDARKVTSNLALGKPISGTAPDAKHSGGKAGLASLVDGKLGTPSPNDQAWLGYPPTAQDVSFIIDLGKPTDISSVGVNVLAHPETVVHFPSKIDISISENGTDYRRLLSGRNDVAVFDKHARQKNLAKDFKPQSCFVLADKQAKAVRYVKIGIVPDTAVKAWVLLDEIMIDPVVR